MTKQREELRVAGQALIDEAVRRSETEAERRAIDNSIDPLVSHIAGRISDLDYETAAITIRDMVDLWTNAGRPATAAEYAMSRVSPKTYRRYIEAVQFFTDTAF